MNSSETSFVFYRTVNMCYYWKTLIKVGCGSNTPANCCFWRKTTCEALVFLDELRPRLWMKLVYGSVNVHPHPATALHRWPRPERGSDHIWSVSAQLASLTAWTQRGSSINFLAVVFFSKFHAAEQLQALFLQHLFIWMSNRCSLSRSLDERQEVDWTQAFLTSNETNKREQ